jgi:hypothetical protein
MRQELGKIPKDLQYAAALSRRTRTRNRALGRLCSTFDS